MSILFGQDSLEQELEASLHALEKGTRLPERQHIDYKEEPGRRDDHGNIRSGMPQNDHAAQRIAEWAACMANTTGGGALIIGVNDKNKGPLLIGTNLDPQWLRSRIYDLTNRLLTPDITTVTVNQIRLLIVRCPQAMEPIRMRNKIHWRVGDSCVEVDASTWHHQQLMGYGFDWSAQPSNLSLDQVSATAIEAARSFLTDSADAEPESQELAGVPASDLLKRLNVVTADGKLTNAGVVMFIGTSFEALDYQRRPAAGLDSQERFNPKNMPLVIALRRVFELATAYNPRIHISSGLVARQVRQIPERSLREAIVNGVAHRDWNTPNPTVVEHIGSTLRVVSPGGFFGGVNEHNIITHPSVSRNKALTELLAALRVAEREGIGVDRMYSDMVSLGLQTPSIRQIDGPYVETVLIGDQPDQAWLHWLETINPPLLRQDLRGLLALRRIVSVGWVDAELLSMQTQSSPSECQQWLEKLQSGTINSRPIIQPVSGQPEHRWTAYTSTSDARILLNDLDQTFRIRRKTGSKTAIAADYAQHRGRISTTELGSILNVKPNNLREVLAELEEERVIVPSWPSHRGRGFHYLYAETIRPHPDEAPAEQSAI